MGSLSFSFDLEDWNQLVARSAGVEAWDTPRPGLERQMRSVFSLLDELGVKATFFMLGITVKNYPDVAKEVVHKGHEVACHGYGHERVYDLTEEAFRADVERSIETIEGITGVRPVGYRAPAFSINRDTIWAFDVLADLGFQYDSSLQDSPRVPRRIGQIPAAGYRMTLPSGRTIWEIPLAVVRFGKLALPVGGGSYWRVLPSSLLRRGLKIACENGCIGLYLHPYECDPQNLSAPRPQLASAVQRARAAMINFSSNIGRRQINVRLRDVARQFQLVKYGDAIERLRQVEGPSTRALSRRGIVLRPSL